MKQGQGDVGGGGEAALEKEKAPRQQNRQKQRCASAREEVVRPRSTTKQCLPPPG